MLIQRGELSAVWGRIKAAAEENPDAPTILLLVAHDVDALAACAILSGLMEKEHLSFKVRSVRDYSEMGDTYVEQIADNPEWRSVILLNCAASINLMDHFQGRLNEADGADPDAPQRDAAALPHPDCNYYVIDSHRPFDIQNLHEERVHVVNDDAPNPLRLFQIWLNLPAASKMVDTAFVMHWAEDVQTVSDADAGYALVVWAGECNGCAGQPPPPHSWAADPNNDVSVYFITVHPGGSFTIPPSKIGADSNRTTYFFEGDKASIDFTEIPAKSAVTMDAGIGATITVPSSASTPALLLVLQGRPIGEPVAQHGPFVMNTREEINKAFSDYQATRFGGWPWPKDAVVFPKDKGRFALVDGAEMRPPGYATSRAKEDL